MAKANLQSPIKIAELPRGAAFALLYPGVDAYQKVRTGVDVTLTDPEGNTIDARPSSRRIDSLGAILPVMGNTFAPLVNKSYDVVSVADALDAWYPDNPRASAIGELYTLVTFMALPYAEGQGLSGAPVMGSVQPTA